MSTYFVYGITDCPACLRACADLMDSNKEYVFIETDFAKTYRSQLKEEFAWGTFPIIVKRTEADTLLIGGYEELQKYLDSEPGQCGTSCSI